MKKIDNYGLRLCKFQGELFQKSLDMTECSSRIFIRRFMQSDLAKRMDRDGFMFDAISVTDGLTEIEVEFGPSNYGQTRYGQEELYWIGYIYRYWSYITGKSSKQLYKTIKPDELEKLYFPYHSLDPEQAIERINDAKGLLEEDSIKKGVEVLRRIRAKNQ